MKRTTIWLTDLQVAALTILSKKSRLKQADLIVSGKQGAPCGRLMPVQSYRHGNHLHRETSLLQPKRTRGVDCPVSLQRITRTTVRRAAWPKAGNIAELDPEGGPREFARQGNDRLSRTSFAFGSGHRAVGG